MVVADFWLVLREVGDSNVPAPNVAMIPGPIPGATYSRNYRHFPIEEPFFVASSRDWGGIHPVTEDSFRICKNLSLFAQLQL
jgi:hypothetical protein